MALVQLVPQVHQEIQFVAARVDWSQIQIQLLDANPNVFEIQTANTVMYVKTKDVLRNQIHVTHLPVALGLHAHQIVLEIQFAGKIKIIVSKT